MLKMRRTRRRRGKTYRLVLPILAGLLILLLIIAVCLWRPGAKQPTKPPTPTTPSVPPAPTLTLDLPQKFVEQNTASKYIVLYDLTGNKTLFSKQADVRCYPASTTKLLTAIVTVKYATADTVFTVGDEIRLIDPQSSRAYLRIGNRLDLQTLLEAILIPSGNDAAYVAAAHIGRVIAGDTSLSAKAAVSRFCEEMNKTAAALGATHSHFVNPDGIHNSNHYTTANDMLLIAKHAYAQPLIAAVMKEEEVTRTFLSGETGATWYNTNYLLRTDTRYYYPAATGMKTGHTDEAGHCLVATAEKDGATLLAVLLGANESYGRFEDATGLFTVCFDSLR